MMHTQNMYSQRWLIDRIKALDYPINEIGICNGIAKMAMLAILANDSNRFARRLQLIHQIPIENFAEHIEKIRNSDPQLRSQYGADDWEIVREIPAFFDGITLNQEGAQLVDVSLDVNPLDLTLPTLLSEAGGIFEYSTFSGMYTEKELVVYLRGLKTALESAAFQHPVPIILESANHAICITYDTIQREWLLVDANHLVFTTYPNTQILAKAIVQAISNEYRANSAFVTKCFGLASEKQVLSECMDRWRNSLDYRNIHTVTPKKARMLDGFSQSWLILAMKEQDGPLVTSLLSAGADPNQCFSHPHFPIIGVSPLLFATMLDRPDFIQALLEKGANPNMQVDQEMSALLFSAIQGSTHCGEALLADPNTNVNIQNEQGVTPLFIAAQSGNLEMLTLLMQHQADMSIACNMPIEVLQGLAAEKPDTIEMIHELIQSHHTLHPQADTLPITPEQIAKLMGHDEIAAQLHEAGEQQSRTRFVKR